MKPGTAKIGPLEDLAAILAATLREIVSTCPGVKSSCYWAGTSAIALEELKHRDSFDIDLHTIHALEDLRPLLAELDRTFSTRLLVAEPPGPYRSGFQGIIQVADGKELTLQVMANFEEVPLDQLVDSTLIPGLRRVGLGKDLRDKLTCLVERAEARDLVDVMFSIEHRPSLESLARRALSTLDEVLLAERLLSWTDQLLEADLKAYPGVDPGRARQARDLLLSWLGK